MKDDRVYIAHILECIVKIENYTSGGEDAFARSELIQDAVIRNLEIVGEAAKRLSPCTDKLTRESLRRRWQD